MRQTFTSSGSEDKAWETFTLAEAVNLSVFEVVAVEGPDFSDSYYPTLRVADFQVVGEMVKTPGHFDVRLSRTIVLRAWAGFKRLARF